MLAHPLFAQADRWDHMNGWGGGWMWLWGVAMMTIFTVLVIWLIRVGSLTGPALRDPAERAREILAERYAKGELSTEEFRERSDELK